VSAATAPVGEPVVRVGGYVVCLDAERRLLLARIHEPTPDDGRWTLPGGGLRLGETPEAGAIREVAEETGLVVELDGLAASYTRFFPRSATFGGRPLHFLGFVYRGHVVGGTLRDEVGGTTDRCGWFSRAEMDELPLVGLAREAMPIAWPDGPG
jgi:8-oxo-dGTP diphosphatase